MNVNLHRCNIFYWMSFSKQHGSELSTDSLELNVCNELPLVPIEDGLFHRPEANWSVRYLNCDLTTAKTWLCSTKLDSGDELYITVRNAVEKSFFISVSRVSYQRGDITDSVDEDRVKIFVADSLSCLQNIFLRKYLREGKDAVEKDVITCIDNCALHPEQRKQAETKDSEPKSDNGMANGAPESDKESNDISNAQCENTVIDQSDLEETKQNLLSRFSELITEDFLKKYLTEGKDAVEKDVMTCIDSCALQPEHRKQTEEKDPASETASPFNEDYQERSNVDANNGKEESPDEDAKNKKKSSARCKRLCPFCGKFFGSLTKHIRSTKHKNELEVIEAMKMKKQERDNAFKLLRRKGFNQVNIQRIKEANGDDYMLINERNRGNETSYFMCSFCRGTFAKSSITKHKRICFVTEGTTLSPVSVPVTLMTDTGTVTFRDNILANFTDDVVGNLCRSEELIRECGEYHYKRAFSTLKKKIP